ncbi:MAG: thioredoxin domain-containing protein [Patescibacteria group bacterium]
MEQLNESASYFTRKSSPRLYFWLGIICGGLIISLAGLAYIGYLYAGGAFILRQDEEIIINHSKQPIVEQAVENINKKSTEVSIGDYDYAFGSDNAPITLVVFTDYECQLCKIFHKNLLQFVGSTNQVKMVVKNFILTQKHPLAYEAGISAMCAGEQGKYYEYAQSLFDNQNILTTDYFNNLATELQLNSETFKACTSSPEMAEKIEADYQQGLDFGIHGIPNTLVLYPDETVKLIDGNVSVDFLQSLLKEYL